MSADQSDAPAIAQNLPDPLPGDPFPLFQSWFDEAREKKVQPNPNAMSLATIDSDGTPSCRVVLCKYVRADLNCIVFFTNYHGRKGRALEANRKAAVCFHWDALDRQVRMEGLVTRSPVAESDAYFATRPLESQIGAWASDQSEPIGSREELFEKAAIAVAQFCEAPSIPRPDYWGGYRLWVSRVEFWVGGVGRMHDRAGWTRPLTPGNVEGVAGFIPSAGWSATRLQP